MQLEAVLTARDRRNPALRPVCIGIGAILLGDDGHLTSVSHLKSVGQPGHTAPENDEVE